MLRRAVLERAIPLDAPLPSTRELASELGVARATVAIAYERLQIEGAIESRAARLFRDRHVRAEAARVSTRDQLSLLPPPDWAVTSARLTCRIAGTQSAGLVPLSLPFVYGQIDARLFPLADWREMRRTRDQTGKRRDLDGGSWRPG